MVACAALYIKTGSPTKMFRWNTKTNKYVTAVLLWIVGIVVGKKSKVSAVKNQIVNKIES